MIEVKNQCSICAWRATCQKKFSMSGRDVRCPDYCRDLMLEADAEAENSSAVSEGRSSD